MSSMAARFLARIQSNLRLWRAGEIDFATFNEGQREIWEAIHTAGTEVEASVLSSLTGSALCPVVPLQGDDGGQTVQLRSLSPATPEVEARRYRGELRRTQVGSPVLRVSSIDPRHHPVEHRQMAALVYELAADMERRSHQLEAHWSIAPDVEHGQVVVELAGDHEAALADEFIINVMTQHQLI